MLRELLAIKWPETHFKDFMATFLSSRFGAKTGFPASGDLNVSCYAFAVICAFSNYFKTNSFWYFHIICKEDVKTVLISIMYLFLLFVSLPRALRKHGSKSYIELRIMKSSGAMVLAVINEILAIA